VAARPATGAETTSKDAWIVTAEQWGRVETDGTVWVRTAEGERVVGQYPGATPQDALAYFARKFDDLAAQVSLFEQRIASGHVSAAETEGGVERLAAAIADAHAVGDLDALAARVAALRPLADALRAEAEQAKAQARAEAVAQRAALVDDAEAIAATDVERIPWKSAGDRLRELFEEWRRLQRESRLDKHTEDELWKRFSHARTAFDRKRRQHFGALDEQRNAARALKEALVADAEALSASTDWAATAAAYRDLMARWKAAGRAARKDDDALWARFRAAQDAFFAARNAAAESTDTEFRENLTVKESLLARAEALLPVTDVHAARAVLRDIHDEWEAAGKVPRGDLGRIEARLRAVEQAVRSAEDERWARSNPQARARAEDVVRQLETGIASLQTALESARAAGREKTVRETEQTLAARQEWLAEARKALAEFGG
jgi:exonuclease VII small subunit